jgi:hypothetical protein
LRIDRAARAERKRYEEAYRRHIMTCLDCYRQFKGEKSRYCHVGAELRDYIALMERQEELLSKPAAIEYEQLTLW